MTVRMTDYAYRNAFFAMVRAWHNRRATNSAWKPFWAARRPFD
jgi:hypothetical protein